ncbi:MAG: hypothetical protein K5683_09560 [Prevotella sp.]|nr:hypothetical protein [Prevotella sp.]
MDEIDIKDFSAKADGILKKMGDLVLDEIDKVDDEITLPLLLYVLTKFSANLLLGLKKSSEDDVDIAEYFFKSVRELMPILERNLIIQSNKEEIEDIKEEIAELKQKRDETIMTMFLKNDGLLN